MREQNELLADLRVIEEITRREERYQRLRPFYGSSPAQVYRLRKTENLATARALQAGILFQNNRKKEGVKT